MHSGAPSRVGSCDLHGLVLRAKWPVTRLIADMLTSLGSVAGQLPVVQADVVLEAALTLLAGGLRGSAADGQAWDIVAPTIAGEQMLRRRVLEFIEARLDDPNLDVGTIRAHFRVSRAHLYRAFEKDRGVARVIRERRLAMVWKRLRDCRQRPPLKAIAAELGFSSGSQLSRSFVDHFGMTPGESMRQGYLSPLPMESGLARFQTQLIELAGSRAGA